METFDRQGHLTEEFLQALAHNQEIDLLPRLEGAEHLAWCDTCLQRYTSLLTPPSLAPSPPACPQGFWRRVRSRQLRRLAGRYAAAAAAVALALAVVWGGGPSLLARTKPASAPLLAQAGQAMNQWADTWPQAMEKAFSGLTLLFDHPGGSSAAPQGGTQS